MFLICAGILAAPASSNAANGFFGVVSQRDLATSDFTQMKAGGVESLRVGINWPSYEPQRDQYDWGHLDPIIGGAAAAGIPVLPFLYDSPRWLSADWKTIPTEGHGLDEWNSMLAAIVGRYGDDGSFWAEHPELPKSPIATWQIWNEPNTVWFAEPGQVEQYAKLVVSSAATIRAADPGAKVMLGGLMASPPSAIGPNGDDYLRRLYSVPGFSSAFDSVAVQPYNVSVSETMADLARVRQVMNTEGDSAKGIIVTEIGWASDSISGLGMKNQAGQARRLREAYREFLRARKGLILTGVYWYAWQDQPIGVPSCSFCFGSGLLDSSGNPKLAWSALKDVIRNGISATAPGCVVPRLRGLKVGKARRLLRKAHCGVKVVKRKPRGGGVKAGIVIAQSPGPNASRKRATKVRVTVARR